MRWLLGKYGEELGKNIPTDKMNKVYFWLLLGIIAFGVLYVLSFYIWP